MSDYLAYLGASYDAGINTFDTADVSLNESGAETVATCLLFVCRCTPMVNRR